MFDERRKYILKIKQSLLLFFTSPLPFPFASRPPNSRRLGQLLDQLHPFDLVIESLFAPHLLNLAMVLFVRLLFHSHFFSRVFLGQVFLVKCRVFVSHYPAFIPLTELVFVVNGLVAAEVALDLTDGRYFKLVETKLKVNQRVVVLQGINTGLPNLLVQVVVCHI